MADYDASGASEPVTGASRALEDVTQDELMRLQPDPQRPDWMVTRFPVSMEEFARISEAARRPEPAGLSPEEKAAIEDPEAEVTPEGELPEDESPGPALAPTITANFEGIPRTAFQPPDNTVAVGPSHVLLAVNTDLVGYDKAGTLLFRWPNMTTLFRPVLPEGASLFDPRLAYDHYAKRWIVVAAARRGSPRGSWIMLAASQGTNPAGPYWVWALDATRDGTAASDNWADYPMLGFDTQGIYISTNQFQFAGGFQYAKLRILNKAEVYSGGTGTAHAIRFFDFWGLRNADGSLAFTVQPAAHFRGATGNPPAYLVNALWPGGTSLSLWTLTNPLGFWSGGSPALGRVAVNCLRYDLPPDAEQPGTSIRIETNDARLLNAVYQNAGGTQRLWTCHTVRHTWGGDAEARATLQFYEIDVPSHAVAQQNRFGAPGMYYFFPAIQTDISRNAYVVFGRCSANEFAQVRETGRRISDPPGSLQGSALVQVGRAAYTGGRWGDYFGICRDGGASGTAWMYGEYAGLGNTWATKVCAATLPVAPRIPTAEMEQLRASIQTLIQEMVPERKPVGRKA